MKTRRKDLGVLRVPVSQSWIEGGTSGAAPRLLQRAPALGSDQDEGCARIPRPASRAPRPGDTHPAPPPPARSRPAARPPRALLSAPLAPPIGVVWRSSASGSFTSPALVG